MSLEGPGADCSAAPRRPIPGGGPPAGRPRPPAIDVNPMELVRPQSVGVEQVRPGHVSGFPAQADRREAERPDRTSPERPRCGTTGHRKCRATATHRGGRSRAGRPVGVPPGRERFPELAFRSSCRRYPMSGRQCPTQLRSPVGRFRPGTGVRSRGLGRCRNGGATLVCTRAVQIAATPPAHDLPKTGRTVSRMYRSLFLM